MRKTSNFLPSAMSLATHRRYTVVDQVHDILLGAIVTGDLGPGEVLHDQTWATRLEVSRTPIREAIKRLEGHGIVSVAAARYTRIATFTVEQARHEVKDWSTIHRALADSITVPADPGFLEDLESLRTRMQDSDGPERSAACFTFFERLRAQATSFSIQLGATAAAYRVQLALSCLPEHDRADDLLCDEIISALRANAPVELPAAFDRWADAVLAEA